MSQLTLQPQFELPRLVDQAIMHEVGGARPGDCLRAALATITDSALLEVPHFVEFGDDCWLLELQGFVRRWSLGRHEIMWFPPYPQPEHENTATLATSWGTDPAYGTVLCGPSPRGPFGHAVVGDPTGRTMLHDPHPSRAGILSVDYVMALVRSAA